MQHSLTLWILFNAFIILMLIVDLKVFNRKPHEISIKESLVWTGIWISQAVIFGIGIHIFLGPQSSLNYFTGYLIEKSLSVDNIFVFLLIFTYFGVDAVYQHRVLFWGIFGALVFRFLFIIVGVALINQFHWIIYIFGAFLVYTGIKLSLEKNKEIHPEKNPVISLVRRFLPVTKRFHEHHFIIKRGKRIIATPLLIVLVVVETSDIVFALDSIPAIMAVTRDSFLIYSANAFAILGLRALYFALSGVMKLFHYLHYGLAFILVFIGFKMILEDVIEIHTFITLSVIVVTLAISILLSILYPEEGESELPDEENRD